MLVVGISKFIQLGNLYNVLDNGVDHYVIVQQKTVFIIMLQFNRELNQVKSLRIMIAVSDAKEW